LAANKNNEKKMKIAIIGSGGVGGYFGAKLAKAGNDVTFLARGDHLKAIKENGLEVKSIKGDFKIFPSKATNSIKEIGQSDLIIMAVKAWQVKELAPEIKEIAHSQSIILPMQNGIQAADELAEVIDKQNIIGGLCRIISKIEAPGIINHFGVEPSIVFGELDNSKTVRILKLKGIIDQAGINSKISEDITAELWKKLISICVSGLLTVSKTTYGELREIKETRQLMLELLTEIYNLSQKIGIKIEPEFVSKTMAFADTFPYNSTSSLARDVWEGKPSEIEYQNGTVVRLAEKYGIEVPVNRFVYSCILPMEKKARRII
jgi:2-dehydropantoate 2-reductase